MAEMLERDVRSFAESHARSVIVGDQPAVMSDVSFDAAEQLTTALANLPHDVVDAVVEICQPRTHGPPRIGST